MSVEWFGGFLLAAGVILVVPGPTIILVVSRAAVCGRRAVLPLAAGVALGDLTAMSLSLLGLGAVLASSALLFTVLKWIGAGYLVYLGVRTWRSAPRVSETLPAADDAVNGSLLRSAFVVTALNPKSIAFFVAFLPQFVDPRAPALPQLLVLGTTFLVLAFLNAAAYGAFAGRLRDRFRDHRVQRRFHRCGGVALVGAGLVTATLQRSS